MSGKTLKLRILDLCEAIAADIKTLFNVTTKLDNDFKIILEDENRLQITDYYSYDFRTKANYIKEGFNSIRVYHDNIARIGFFDVLKQSNNIRDNILVFKLNHNNGGVVKFKSLIMTKKSIIYSFNPIKNQLVEPLKVFKEDEWLYNVPYGISEIAVTFHEKDLSVTEIDYYSFTIGNIPYTFQIMLTNQPVPKIFMTGQGRQAVPDYGKIASFENYNLIRNSTGAHPSANFSKFVYEPQDFGSGHFVLDKPNMDVQLDDYYKYYQTGTYVVNFNVYCTNPNASHYSYFAPYDKDGIPIYAHEVVDTKVNETINAAESTTKKLVINGAKQETINLLKSYAKTPFAIIVPGKRFELSPGGIKLTNKYASGPIISPGISRAVILPSLTQNTNVKITINEVTRDITLEFLGSIEINKHVLSLINNNSEFISFAARTGTYLYFSLINTKIPTNPTTYVKSINAANPTGSSNPDNNVFNKAFKHAAYFKIGFVANANLINGEASKFVIQNYHLQYTG